VSTMPNLIGKVLLGGRRSMLKVAQAPVAVIEPPRASEILATLLLGTKVMVNGVWAGIQRGC